MSEETPTQRESREFWGALDADTKKSLMEKAERNKARTPVPDRLYGQTPTGQLDHIAFSHSGFRSYCGRRLAHAGLIPVNTRVCSRCLDAWKRFR